jgi:hypothetical protein
LAGGTISKGGLTYSNFQMTRLTPTTPSTDNVSALASDEPVIDGFNVFRGYYDDFLYVGAYNPPPIPIHGGLSESDSSGVAYFSISFAVAAANAGQKIDAATFESRAHDTSNYASSDEFLLSTFKVENAGGVELGSNDNLELNFFQPQSPIAFDKLITFSPQSTINVEAAFGTTGDELSLTAFVFSFNLVPEPGAFAIATMACATCIAGVRNKRSE